MRYLCLIYMDEKAQADMSEQQMGAVMEAYGKYVEEVEKAGAMLGGEALQPTDTATTVQVRDGKTLTTDGPFAETKEQLGRLFHDRGQRPGRSYRMGSQDPRRSRWFS